MLLLNLLFKSTSDCIFISFIAILSLGIGKKIWSRWFDLPVALIDIVEEGVFCIAIGFGMLSLLVLLIGLLGLLRFWIVLFIMIILFIFTFGEIKKFFLNAVHIKKDFFHTSSSSFFFFALSPFLMIALIWLFIASRVPPVFYDAMVYHLGIPNQYLVHHAIKFMPYAFHSHHPFLIQNLFSICLLLGGYGTTKLLVLMFALLNAISISLLAIKLYGSPIDGLAGMIFLISPTVLIMGSLVNVDLGFSFYTLLAFYALCIWANQKEKKWLFISAIMAGLSLGTKYTSIIFCFGLCLLCLFFILIKEWKNIKFATTIISVYILIALTIGSGWYIKNFIWTRNPFYPKWADIWGTPKIPQKNLEAFYASAHAFNSKDQTRNSILYLPIETVLHPERFGAGGTMGPLFLILLPLVLIPDKKNRLNSILGIYCVAYFGAWAFSFRMTRFAMPLFAILLILATHTWIRLWTSKWKWLKYLIIVILMLGFSYNLYYSITTFSKVYDPWTYLTGKETEDSYLSRAIPSYPIFRYINNELPAQSRILFLGETVNFYCLRDVISPTAYDINPFVPVLKEAKTKKELREFLKQMGVTHLLINFPEIDRLDHSYGTFGFTDNHLKLIRDVISSSHVLARRGDIILIRV